MPYSLKGGKEQTAQWFSAHQNDIKRILDIGPGSGTYARLIKEEHNICKDVEWVGVEIWTPYIEKYNLKSLYNHIINEDARKLDWNSLGQFSVAIAGDVLEHMTKEEAMVLVNNILDHCDTLIVSIPISHMPQDEHSYENPHEAHIKDNWTHEEVLETWNDYIFNFYRKSVKSKLAVYWMRNENN